MVSWTTFSKYDNKPCFRIRQKARFEEFKFFHFNCSCLDILFGFNALYENQR